MHISFFMFFSDFVIYQVVKWMFLIFHDFKFSCHFPCPTVDIAKFSTFLCFPCHISRPKVCISYDQHFQLSCHIPGPTVCIYQFSSFSIFLIIFHYLTSVIVIFRYVLRSVFGLRTRILYRNSHMRFAYHGNIVCFVPDRDRAVRRHI